MRIYTEEQRERRRIAHREWYHRNRTCNLEKQNMWRRKNRDYFLRKTYGLTWEDYEALLTSQGKVCAICSSDVPGPGRKRFDVDHNHDTGKIRGLLCLQCNSGIGNLRDSSQLLRQAADYLDRNN